MRTIKLSEICQELELRKENMLKVIFKLVQDDWVEIISSIALECSVRICKKIIVKN